MATKYERSTNIRNRMTKVRRKDLIYPELCYQIIGILFEIWTELGHGHKEKIYQKAITKELKNLGLKFKEQLPTKICYKDEPVGIYYFDFLVENKIVLEIKVRNYFSTKDIKQLYSYLRAKKLKLGIIAHFTRTGVKFKRVINLN